MKTDEQQGLFLNVVVGIIGALLGGMMVSLVGGDGVNGFNVYSLLVSTVGAVVLLAIVKTVRT